MFSRLTPARLMVLIAFLGLFAMATRVAVDSDTFWHLRAGLWMLENGRLLNFDVFSHTRLNEPWINHSWLSEIMMAAIYRVGGFSGLNLWTALVVWLAFVFVYRSSDSGPYLKSFALILAAATSGVYWSARPQIVSMLLAAVFNWVLIRFRFHGLNRLWLLPLLMVAWVNLHGGFVIGFILLVVTCVGEALTALLAPGPLTLEKMKAPVWVAAAGLLCAAAVMVNPYGPQMLLYPFKTVSIGVLQDYIQEWQSPNFHAREAQVFIVMWLATFAAVGFGRRPLQATDFLLFAAFSALALLAGRNIAVFAVVSAPILVRHADSAIAELQARWPRLKLHPGSVSPAPLMHGLNWTILALVIVAVLIKVSLPLNPATTRQAIALTAPVGAADFLKTHPYPGRLFNSYNFGGYLTWALYPEMPVYVDGRTDLYDDAFLTQYLNAYLAGPGWQAELARYGVGIVLVEPGAPIARALMADPHWAVRYLDATAIVLIHPDPALQP
jgi:hypothetical protein